MSLRTPLGRVLGHGSAKEGVSHWWLQRVSSVALVPLTLWFIFALLGLPSFDYLTVRSWMGAGWTPVFLLLLVATLTYHSWLGVQVVLEDYVHTKLNKTLALTGSSFLHAIVGAASVFAVLKIAFQGAA
jgi:succinate dehydrogenase / fumarate reductase membrane anchor subunit